MDFDLLLCSNAFLTLTKPGSFDRATMIQSRAHEAVKHIAGIAISNCRILEPQSQLEKRCLTIAIHPGDPIFTDPELAAASAQLSEHHSMLLDRRSMPGFEAWQVGDARMIGDQTIEIIGAYDLGIGVLANLSNIVSHETLTALRGKRAASPTTWR